jgi:hypothetical protein
MTWNLRTWDSDALSYSFQVIFMSPLSSDCSKAAEMFESSLLTSTLWDSWDWTSPYQTLCFLFTHRHSLPDFRNHQTVIKIKVISSDKSQASRVEYHQMSMKMRPIRLQVFSSRSVISYLSLFRCENIVPLTELSMWQGLLLQQNFHCCFHISSLFKFSLWNLYILSYFALKSSTRPCVTTVSFLQSSLKLLQPRFASALETDDIPSAMNLLT